MRCFLALCLFISLNGMAQWKDYRLTTKGDTVNRIDPNNRKQGKWISRIEENMGEPGFQEEGVYKDDLKEGDWKVYSLMGDPIGEEKYVYGQKSGTQRDYDIHGNLLREESWKAITPDNQYDTISVPDWKRDVTGAINKTVIVKLEGNALRHGTWKYYDEQSRLIRTEVYILDKISESTVITYDYKTGKLSGKEKIQYDIETGRAISAAAYQRPKEVEKPKVAQDFEKTKKGKSKRYVDGSTGG
jgi:antitoxin component YwqK of YwqJK toxin-antitoxin module